MKTLLALLFLFSSPTMAQLVIEDHIKFLSLGDSYTIGESVAADQRWPLQLIDSLSKRGLNHIENKIIAVTGWRTDNLKEAINKAKLKPEFTLVSLLIGVNNYYQGKSVESYAPEFEDLLKTSVALAGGVKSHVFVLSIPDYGFTPFGKNNIETITQGIDAFNAANESITKKWGVKYYNITDISRRGVTEPDLIAFDGLHPSGKMYSEWVKRILSDLSINMAEEDDAEEEEDQDNDEGDGGKPNGVTGVKDEQYGFHVYPNPFDDFITIESIHSSRYTVELIAPNGSVALSVSDDEIDSPRKIDTRSLSSGNYTLTLNAFGKILKSEKLLKI